jgi:hypothetical protein
VRLLRPPAQSDLELRADGLKTSLPWPRALVSFAVPAGLDLEIVILGDDR